MHPGTCRKTVRAGKLSSPMFYFKIPHTHTPRVVLPQSTTFTINTKSKSKFFAVAHAL